MLEALRRLTDLANRASVVIYTMDARGLPVWIFPLPTLPRDDPDQFEQQLLLDVTATSSRRMA